MDPLQELLDRCQNLSELSDDDLGSLLADLRAEAERVLEDDPTDEQLDLLDQAAVAVEQIETEQTSREQSDAERQDRIAQLRDRIADSSDGDGEGNGDGEGDGEGDDSAEGDGGSADASAEGDAPQPVAASADGTPPARQAPARTRARRPNGMRPENRSQAQPLSIVAAANLPDISAGTRLETPDALAQAFMAAYRAAEGYRGPRVKVPVGRIGTRDVSDLYGPERTLGMDPEANEARIQAVIGPSAITAAGGRCVPSNVSYDMPTLGTDARPVRDDMMVRFGVDRGGAKTFPPPVIDDLDDSVSVWTESTDQTPGGNTKPCLTVTCPEPNEDVVEAITRCLQFGNFRARFFGEQVQAWIDLSAVAHARFAENRLLTKIGDDSTQVSSGQVLGASIDVLTTLDRAVAAMESRWRLGDAGVPLRFGAPFWLLDMMRTDIARRLPGGGTQDERMAVADAVIQRWIETRGVNVTWFLDGETGQIFGPQGDGPLVGWPSTVVTYLYPEGSWLFLDGGTLDFGIVRDSTLNSKNNYQVFMETFEGAHFHGVESQRITMDLCPDGSVSSTVDINPCSTGS